MNSAEMTQQIVLVGELASTHLARKVLLKVVLGGHVGTKVAQQFDLLIAQRTLKRKFLYFDGG